ncbi:MAG: glycosyltransferase [Alcanivoracaceae bacterium]|nr:glycosyltransferase [Alcanivoracaceae bacterium]
MENLKPYLAIYNANKKTVVNNINKDRFQSCFFAQKHFTQDLREAIIAATTSNIPIVIIDAQVQLPPLWFERLEQVLNQNAQVQLCSALSCHVNTLSPLAVGSEFKGTVAELDHLIFLLQSPASIFCDQINPECFIVRDNNILQTLHKTPFVACNNLLAQSHQVKSIKLTDIIDIGNQKPLPAHPLAALQWQLRKYSKAPVDFNGGFNNYPILDKKPVMLHICMGWGGGVHQWINDYCQHEKSHQHLILSSNGELYRQSHGESLSLYFPQTDGIVIRHFDLQAPIKATCTSHAEYKQILDSIITQFQIQQIVVSSLIGHSMECLQTKLATLRVLHDYFPSWPSLIADLEQDIVDAEAIDKALAQTENEPFGLISKQQYLQWRKHLHETYQNKNIKLIAPSQSVVDNLSKIDASAFKDVTIIPHAIEPLRPLNYQKKATTFQILVLGRINPPKGQALLEEVMQELGGDYHFVLIGAGNEGKKYLNTNNITVVMDYKNNELQQLLDDTEADVALITSQTSETFNYTLSELQQAGICTISTTFGALKERIIDGETGFLCENSSQSIANTIRDLRQNPDKIRVIRNHLKQLDFQQFTDEINQYQQLLMPLKDSDYKLQAHTNSNNIWAKELQYLNKQKLSLTKNLKQTQNTLEVRTTWGQKLTKELKSADENIKLERQEAKYLKQTLQKETSRMTAEIEQLGEVFKHETSRLESEINELNNGIKSLNAQYETTYKKYEDTHKQLQQTEVDLYETQFKKEKVEQQLSLSDHELSSVYNSRSWRITKPMRKFTTWARHKRNAIKFRWAQLKTFPSRAIRSLKTRGFAGTVSIVKGKLNKSQTQVLKEKVVEISHNFETLKINTANKPTVSIIIPVYNHFEHTYNCLKSIAALQDECSFEVIVVDDFSSDETETLIKNISGITYQRQKQNGGFIESCNTGAKLAKGQYLMFLNNDTVVYNNWLDALCDVFNNYPDAGLVGSKLVYPDNQLQEAGGIVFADASGWNYGRLGKPDEPWYNHIREVDYCSGASILISNKLFIQLGYFDERYKPAYYEDTDLAFAVRNIGKKVYYQPASKITHFEGISSGTDLTAGMKKYQVINQTKFKEKWAKQLTKQQKSGTDIELCRIHGQPKRILIFDACTPTPDQDSGSLRMINLIKILKELNYHVIFMPENLSHNKKYTQALQQLGVECIYTPFISNPVDYLKQKGQFLDAVILSRYYVAEPVMPFIREYCPKAQIIFDTVDLHYVRERRMAELENDTSLAKIAEATREKELAVAKACDTTLVVSPYEVEVLAEELPNTQVKVLTNIHEIYGCRKAYKQRKDIMFIGGYQHTPNVDAIEWFVAEIFPLIAQELPELKFHIVGSKAPKHIQEMATDNIIFHGFVEDIEPYMDDIRIAVAPLRYGAGVKGKVNMSMSYGQPVVGTKVAVEGMFTQEGVDVLMAETPEQFAQQVVRLYQDEKIWNTVSQGGLANVQSYFSFDAAKQAIKSILDK